jgi:hypothetical protein
MSTSLLNTAEYLLSEGFVLHSVWHFGNASVLQYGLPDLTFSDLGGFSGARSEIFFNISEYERKETRALFWLLNNHESTA